MERTVTGSITSAQLGNIGRKQYGFIDIKTEEREEIKIKVAAFTKYDTLDIGKRVLIVAESLGNMGVMTAKSISLAE
jgi:starvation-inducible outer membrane lipoprotein